MKHPGAAPCPGPEWVIIHSMQPPVEPVYVVHISDTHVGPDRSYARFGRTSWPCARQVVDLINHLPQRPDVVIHTGDVVSDPDPAAYRLARETFAGLAVPIYYAVGNHDRSADIVRFLPMGPYEPLGADPDLLTYAFEIKGNRFLILDGRAPDHLDPHGLLSEEQLAVVRREAAAEGPPLAVFIHFPVWPLNSTWFDEHMLIVNGRSLHEALLPARPRLRGVFHGHVHMPMQTVRDGIVYSSVASTFANFAGWPDVPEPVLIDEPPGYCFLHFLSGQTLIHYHTFPRPDGAA